MKMYYADIVGYHHADAAFKSGREKNCTVTIYLLVQMYEIFNIVCSCLRCWSRDSNVRMTYLQYFIQYNTICTVRYVNIGDNLLFIEYTTPEKLFNFNIVDCD